MKKAIILVFAIIITNISFGNKLHKGNIVGTHLITVELKQGVTLEEWQEFYITTVIPEFEKNFSGWKVHLLKGIRGKNKNEVGALFIGKSEKYVKKYYNSDYLMNELGLKQMEKMKPIYEELEKLGSPIHDFTDWIVL